ncbi:cell surface hyaluronidase-like [Amphibalanus amphitrite]|uniref:cell surface hyaluronidase-like n=1 Tax=Amphibalanus amphitrite TaxID=1232801 RepID=UPI001C92483F|nr:cell surface hyaluronidase-like [Amphibalanus amphitrite]
MAALTPLLFCSGLVLLPQLSGAACPHQEAGINLWSSNATWPSGAVPSGGDVTINTSVLLDVNSARMDTVTITTGGKLVFDPSADSVRLSASMVELMGGELWIGSEDCHFTGDAEVLLTGKRDESAGAPSVQKAVVVHTGRLEVHGKPKRPWTQLSGTLNKTTREDMMGTPIYSVSDNDDSFSRSGFRMVEFNATGHPVKNWGRVSGASKFNQVASNTGNVVAVVISREAKFDGNDIAATAAAFESLCFNDTKESEIRNMVEGQRVGFAAICHIGTPANGVETVGTSINYRSQTGWLTQTVGSVDFAAMSVVSLTGINSEGQVEAASYATGTVPSLVRTITLDDSVGSWKEGDFIVMASTDYDMLQAQEFEIVECDSCANNQLNIMGPVLFTHWGEVTNGVNMKAEVGILSRNVRFHGEMENACYGGNLCDTFDYDTYGGHIKIHRNFTSARIENAEFFHMGQQPVLAAYPIHFHTCLDTSSKDVYIRKNSIHHTFSRCLTLHATHNVTVEKNVAFDHLGHCFFLEDGGEQDNVFKGNLGLVTRRGTLIPSDVAQRVATFWITNPDNKLIGNHAAGSQGMGIWILMPLLPIGHSADMDLGLTERQSQRTLLKAFRENVVHSNGDTGFRLDDELKSDGTFAPDLYHPQVDPTDPDSAYALLELDDLTAYKNTDGAWLKTMYTHMTNFKFSDNAVGILTASSISDDVGTHYEILANSTFIGESENIGEPAGNITLESGETIQMNRSVPVKNIEHALLGIASYRGPQHFMNITFSGFKNSSLRPAGAIGKRFSNVYFGSPINSVRNVSFDFADPSEGIRFYDGNATVTGYRDRDGNRHNTLMDFDGTLTGHAGCTIVRPIPFLINARCVVVPRWGPGTALCPDRFSRLKIWSGLAGLVPTFMTRNDLGASDPDISLVEQQMSYSLNSAESYILHFNTTVPKKFKMAPYGLQNNVSQLVGVCVGANQTSLQVDPNTYTKTDNMTELKADDSNSKYYYDPSIGVVMFKLTSPYPRGTNTYSHCPGTEDADLNGICSLEIKIELDAENDDGDCRSRAYPAYSTDPVSATGALTEPVF